jgi:hypothetical protein
VEVAGSSKPKLSPSSRFKSPVGIVSQQNDRSMGSFRSVLGLLDRSLLLSPCLSNRFGLPLMPPKCWKAAALHKAHSNTSPNLGAHATPLLHTVSLCSFFLEIQYKHRYLYVFICMSTRSYKYTHTYPISMSTSKRLRRLDFEIYEVCHQECLVVDEDVVFY